jgi:polar amino acid transport system substrate-binding protein
MSAMIRIGLLAAAVLLSSLADTAVAGTLAAIQARGTLGLCAHPNSLPFASKKETPPGFQIELGRAIAKELGVTLEPEWVVSPIQVFRTDCDILLDSIIEADADADQGIKVSKPYYRGGVGLAVRVGSPVNGLSSLTAQTKVGVIASSVIEMKLNQRGILISVFAFEDDMLDSLAAGEIDVAAVTGLSAGYYNSKHPDKPVIIIPPDDSDPDFVWNVGVGMRRSDPTLRDAIDRALDHLAENGTLRSIYASYGITLTPPK